MTQYRKDPDAISNIFDEILAGIGKRGSSFTDVDRMAVAALTHDGFSRRFLFQEFKWPEEECSTGQWWALADLARQPNTTVWLVRLCNGQDGAPPLPGTCPHGLVEWTAFKPVPRDGYLTAETITREEYTQRFARWWNERPIIEPDPDAIPRLIWSEYIKHDPSLQTFLAAELARERIALATAIDEREHWKRVAVDLAARVYGAGVTRRPVSPKRRQAS